MPHRWVLCRYDGLHFPGHLSVKAGEYFAWVNPEVPCWDALDDYNTLPDTVRATLAPRTGRKPDADKRAGLYRDFWNEYVPPSERAVLHRGKLVALDRIVAVDPIGDGHYALVQVFVEFDPQHGPFEPDLTAAWFEPAGAERRQVGLPADDSTRGELFPRPIPDTLYPPPSGFDHVVPRSARKLSSETETRLDALLKSPEETPEAAAHEGGDHSPDRAGGCLPQLARHRRATHFRGGGGTTPQGWSRRPDCGQRQQSRAASVAPGSGQRPAFLESALPAPRSPALPA